MKRLYLIILLILAVFFIQGIAVAQHFGVSAGFNSSTFGGDDADDVDSKTGFLVGGLMIYPISSNNLFLHVEANYTMKGGKLSDLYGYKEAERIFKLNYLEIPVLLHYPIPVSEKVQPLLYGGPALALKLSSKYKTKVLNKSDTETLDDVKSIDFGLMLGGGVNISKMIVVSFRYTLGLTNWSDVTGVDLKNNVISGVVSYTFK